MPTIYDLMTNVRTRLGDPRAEWPSDAQLLQQVTTQIRNILRFKQNTSNPWSLNDTFINIVQNQDTYLITATDFGTPLVVQTVPLNPNQIVRLIPFYCPQNLNYSWGWPQNFGNWQWPTWDGNLANASRCAIYWKESQPYIQFQPIPMLVPAAYQIRYLTSANGAGQASLDSSPLQEQDCDLVEIMAAQALLPIAQWDEPYTDVGRSMNQEMRTNLALSLKNQEGDVRRLFEASQFITTGPRLTQRWNPTTG